MKKRLTVIVVVVMFLLSCDLANYDEEENGGNDEPTNYTFAVDITVTVRNNQNQMPIESAYVTMYWETSLGGDYQISASSVSGYTGSDGSVNLVSSATSSGVNTYDNANVSLNVSASGFNSGTSTITSTDFEIVSSNNYVSNTNYTFYLSPQ